MIRIISIILLLGVICHGQDAKQLPVQEKPMTLTQAELKASAEVLWPIMTVAIGDDRHEKEFGPEKLSKMLAPVVEEVYPLTAMQRLSLTLNKPIREHAQYIKRVNELPDALWRNESKKMLLEWFAEEGRKESDKEAMLVLLILFEPKAEKE